MKKSIMCLALAAAFVPLAASASETFASASKLWTYSHVTAGQSSEIVAFDSLNNNLWVAGIAGVDVLSASNGSLIQHIDTSMFGSINSVAISNGVAAFAIESSDRTDPGVVKFYDTTTRALSSGTHSITVGALPDMLTFTADGSRLLVANEATPTTYGASDPAGSVSIIDMATRSVTATAGFSGVATSGSYLRSNTGMDFEPEYITVNAAGTKAYVSLQEANGMAVLDLNKNAFTSVIGLGVKDFSVANNGYGSSNFIDPNHKDSKVELRPAAVSGLYQPDGMAAYEASGKTYIVMANEGDTREDDGDKERVKDVGTLSSAPSDLKQLNVSTTDSTAGTSLITFGARSFSIRDEGGNIVFDSGSELDAKAIALGIYDDGRSDDKGVEPEGVELMKIGERTFAFIGLERTTKSAVAIYDVTDPTQASFVDMLVSDGDLAPEGLKGFTMNGMHYLAIANEENGGTTSLYSLAPVPEPETYAMLLAGLGVLGFAARRKSRNSATA